ncbi:MAG: glycogen synthase GlgA [Planctomycetota bacterium]
MNIVYLSTEAVPFAKTGGLGDVCGALPTRVARLGHRASLIMPAFQSIYASGLKIEPTDISFAIPMEDRKLMGGRLLESKLPDSDVTVWFIDQPQYFAREGLYGDSRGDYHDNAERFSFFCRAAMQAITRLGWSVDIVHCNDWQSGLVPGLMRADANRHPWVASAASVLTIHNLAYQGNFPAEAFRWTGLDWSHFRHESFEFYNQLNFLKSAIVGADVVTTVSPKYAEEICTAEQGCGLDPVLRGLGDRLVGITNGIDRVAWNPALDGALVKNFDVQNWQEGKLENKRALQKQYYLEQADELPLIGLVGRLAEQKGWDLIVDVLRRHLVQHRPTQWIVLGSGDPKIEHQLKQLHDQHPGQFALHIGFSDELAHQIEAAADIFVMPSRFEPCGLNQLYSMRYGTLPVVTKTGGLADTVCDATPTTVANGVATGFHLTERTADGLDAAIGRALHVRYHEPAIWKKIVETAMLQDWSWRKSAAQYVELYARTLSLKAERAGPPM